MHTVRYGHCRLAESDSLLRVPQKGYIEECEKLKRENDEKRNTVQFLEAKKQTEKEPIENVRFWPINDALVEVLLEI